MSKMSLSNVQKGFRKRPDFILLYGVDGVGKTTFGANAPNPIFLGTEDGSGLITAPRFPIPQNHSEMLEALKVLYTEEHNYETVVIDSLDWWETMLWSHVCTKNNWQSIEDPGFGKGYVAALEQWRLVIRSIQKLREKMNVIIVCHAQVKAFSDPTNNETYDRYQLKLNEKAAALFREAVDNVLFANYDTKVSKEKGATKAKAFGGNDRFLYSERRPAHDAKNRFNLPFKFSLSWDEFIKHKEAAIPKAASSEEKDQVVKIVEGNANALPFLVHKGWIEDGQTAADLSPEKMKLITKSPAKFLDAANEYAAK